MTGSLAVFKSPRQDIIKGKVMNRFSAAQVCHTDGVGDHITRFNGAFICKLLKFQVGEDDIGNRISLTIIVTVCCIDAIAYDGDILDWTQG